MGTPKIGGHSEQRRRGKGFGDFEGEEDNLGRWGEQKFAMLYS